MIHQAQFALDVKAAVLPLYEKVFNVEYPLPKLDTLVVSHFPRNCLDPCFGHSNIKDLLNFWCFSKPSGQIHETRPPFFVFTGDPTRPLISLNDSNFCY